jgi:hypothetical protein
MSEDKLISPPLEYFHRDFKDATYVFNLAPKNYNEVQNNQNCALALLPAINTLITSNNYTIRVISVCNQLQ